MFCVSTGCDMDPTPSDSPSNAVDGKPSQGPAPTSAALSQPKIRFSIRQPVRWLLYATAITYLGLALFVDVCMFNVFGLPVTLATLAIWIWPRTKLPLLAMSAVLVLVTIVMTWPTAARFSLVAFPTSLEGHGTILAALGLGILTGSIIGASARGAAWILGRDATTCAAAAVLGWGLAVPLCLERTLPWFLTPFDLKSFTVVNPGRRATVEELTILFKNKDKPQYAAMMRELDKAETVGAIADAVALGALTDELAASVNKLWGADVSADDHKSRTYFRPVVAAWVTSGVTRWIDPKSKYRCFLEERWNNRWSHDEMTPQPIPLVDALLAAGLLAAVAFVPTSCAGLLGGWLAGKRRLSIEATS
jgi:hypothetical protein